MTAFWSVGELQAARLTGATRHRQSRWTRRMVLQVEVEHPNPAFPAAPPPPGHPYDPWRAGSFRFWRDATFNDLNRLERAGAPGKAGP